LIALLRTTDPIKLGAVRALLEDAGLETEVFDGAAGALWRGIIPVRLMIAEAAVHEARRLLRLAGFVEARDGDWDLRAHDR